MQRESANSKSYMRVLYICTRVTHSTAIAQSDYSLHIIATHLQNVRTFRYRAYACATNPGIFLNTRIRRRTRHLHTPLTLTAIKLQGLSISTEYVFLIYRTAADIALAQRALNAALQRISGVPPPASEQPGAAGQHARARVYWLAGGLRVSSEAGRRAGPRAAAGRGRRTVACVRA
eukprot:3307872-Pleurochrysis_carterae.AAC.2